MAWISFLLFPVIFSCLLVTVVYSQQQGANSDLASFQIQVLQQALDQALKLNNGGNASDVNIEKFTTQILTNPVILNLIQQQRLANTQNAQGASLLILAAGQGSLPLVQVIMQIGTNIDNIDGNGWTALLWAVSKNHTDVAIFLINSGADVNIRNSDYGDTALSWAVFHGNLKITQTLIRAGAEVNVRDFDGDTPLDTAAPKGYLDVVNELIKNGANLDSQDNDGFTALILAVQENQLEVVKALLRANANPNLQTDYYGETAFNWAVNKGYNDIVRELIVFGADINLPNNPGLTPLAVAARLNRFEEARLLLSAGAEIDNQATDGDTALMEAVNLGYSEVVKVFLEHCPNMNIFNKNGNDVISIAANRQNQEITNMIKEHPNLGCTHENVAYLSGNARFDVCREVKCCQGIWSPTGRTLETCGEQCKKVLAPAGVCTEVDNCPRLAEEVKSFLSLPDGFQRGIDLIQSYGCSFFEGNTHICCPTA